MRYSYSFCLFSIFTIVFYENGLKSLTVRKSRPLNKKKLTAVACDIVCLSANQLAPITYPLNTTNHSRESCFALSGSISISDIIKPVYSSSTLILRCFLGLGKYFSLLAIFHYLAIFAQNYFLTFKFWNSWGSLTSRDSGNIKIAK